jgi:peptide/nickel transport system permease protein
MSSTPPETAAIVANRPPSRLAARLRGQKNTVAWFLLLLVIGICALLAPWLAPQDPNGGDLLRTMEGPSSEHWLGTDGLGRDVLSRLLFGARVALLAATQVVLIAVLVGVPIGLVTGYLGRWTDRIVMRIVDAVDSLPFLVVAIALISVVGPGLSNAMTVVGLLFAMSIIRLTRGEVLSAKENVYVDSARVLGNPMWRVLVRHILPNIAAPLIVQITLMFATAIVVEATLSFLGLGVQSPDASWGGMLSTAQEYIRQDFFAAIPPGLAIVVTVLALNQVGDGLRDAFSRESGGALLGMNSVQRTSNAGPVAETKLAGQRVPAAESGVLLSVDGLTVEFPHPTGRGYIPVVRDASFTVNRGEILGLVGESGSGKSITAMSLVGLVPGAGRAKAASIRFDGLAIEGLGFNELRKLRGAGIGVVFQDALSSLNPAFTVGNQVEEVLREHTRLRGQALRRRVVDLFEQVGIPNAAERYRDYPHQFSGGMAQRVMIAMALACGPKLLIADEPTTALDVTVQGQVLDLLLELRAELGMSVLIITHDLGVIADVADRVAVMYAGEIVELTTADELFSSPRHPYTAGLLHSVPRNEPRTDGRLESIPGLVPPPWEWPQGCHFAERCEFARDECRSDPVVIREVAGVSVRCVRGEDLELVPPSRPVLHLATTVSEASE